MTDHIIGYIGFYHNIKSDEIYCQTMDGNFYVAQGSRGFFNEDNLIVTRYLLQFSNWKLYTEKEIKQWAMHQIYNRSNDRDCIFIASVTADFNIKYYKED
jgi:hypothetical protein